MKRLTIILIMSTIILAGLVIAQSWPSYIPETINLQRTYNLSDRWENQTFGNCLIGDTVKLKLYGEYNAVNNTFDYSTSANFGQCVQGMGKRSIDLTNVNTQIGFLLRLRNDIDNRWLQLYNARTIWRERRGVTGS